MKWEICSMPEMVLDNHSASYVWMHLSDLYSEYNKSFSAVFKMLQGVFLEFDS